MQDTDDTTEVEQQKATESTITAKQERFLLAYLHAPTVVAAAQQTGVASGTGERWLKLPHIKHRFDELRRAHFNESLALLATHASDAIAVLVSTAKDETVVPGTRVRAAQILLEQSINVHKLEELERRIAQIEKSE